MHYYDQNGTIVPDIVKYRNRNDQVILLSPNKDKGKMNALFYPFLVDTLGVRTRLCIQLVGVSLVSE